MFGNTRVSIATTLTRTVDSSTIGVKPKTDAAAMPRTETRTSFSRPTTTSPLIDGQSVHTKSPSLVKDSEVSQDLAKLTSTANDTSPLPSTRTATAILSTTSSPGDYAIEDDSESLEEFEDNDDTHEPKLETFPRITPTPAKGISLLSELVRRNTPHNTGSGKPLPPKEVSDYRKTEMHEGLLENIKHYKSLVQLSKKIYCPDQGHEKFGPGMIDAMVMSAPVGDSTSVFVCHRTMTEHHHDEHGNDKEASLIY